ncbi:hypothetical protein BDV25DRAFT_169347 [Aspergillus avenaceus]|uniref:Tc toxin complex TcA C-terminal TcB-binding domain-containing protein n=1 Tax=Aspergillus avenaceus TaxID=36643 RepID=A0A5N6U3K7_ASPAV|nr:hypothetical protein BDV25DRAFT_169347 [Aspergillus avenaceus]
MSSSQVYDRETIQFPLDEPRIRLSVSTEEYKPISGIPVPFDIYAERFDLSTLLEGKISDETYSPQVGLYVSQLNVSQALRGLGVALPGVDGSDDRKDGNNGGSLSIFFDELLPGVAQTLSFKAIGGNGFSPPNQVGVPGQDGGNGGNGGQAAIIFNTLFSSAAETALDIYFDTRNPEKKWPDDFLDDAKAFVKLLDAPEVVAVGFPETLPESMKTEEGFLGSSRAEVREYTSQLGDLLGQDNDAIEGNLMQGIDVDGGDRGFGSTGEGVTGQDGKRGEFGQRQVVFLQDLDNVLQSDVCFAHPMQCQMMLDKATVLTFTGAVEDKASAVTILDRLMRRLTPFADPVSEPEPPLWAAYRRNSSRLFTVESGLSADEPYSIQRLRAIRKQAEVMKQQILSGKDFIGKGSDEVPRGSFDFYHKTSGDLLAILKDFEGTFLDYLNESADAAAKLSKVQMRSDILAYNTSQNDQLIDEAKKDLSQTTRAIGFSVDSIATAKQQLLDSMAHLDDFVEKSFGVSFQDFVSAMNSVIFTGGSKPMIGLQAASLLDEGTEDILRDDGVAVEKSYLIEKLHDIEGSVKDLAEGYNVLHDGHINLEDPGADKILMAEQTWEALVSDFRNAMDPDEYKTVKEKFQTFYDAVQQRNSAVLHYNAILTLLIQYYEKREQMQLDRVDIIREEYNTLDAGHPAMTNFLKKTYDHSIYTAQVWLYKQQQALSFLSLDGDNIIGDTLRGIPSSALDHGLLNQIQGTLEVRRQDYLEAVGQPAQEMLNVRLALDDEKVEFITSTDSHDDLTLRNLEVKMDDPIFRGMYDVRLSAVRFYVFYGKNATSTDPSPLILQAGITHTGTETILNNLETAVEFTHHPLTVLFKYIMPGSETDPVTVLTDGTIALQNDDVYAKVGPFTNWKIDVLREDNEDVDFSQVDKAYLEFDFQYRALETL